MAAVCGVHWALFWAAIALFCTGFLLAVSTFGRTSKALRLIERAQRVQDARKEEILYDVEDTIRSVDNTFGLFLALVLIGLMLLILAFA